MLKLHNEIRGSGNMYYKASLTDYNEIVQMKNEVKDRITKEKLMIWLNDYPNDELIYDDIKKGNGRIIVEDGNIISYASLHLASEEYLVNTFSDVKTYSFSRLMTKTTYLGQGAASKLIKYMLEEVKTKATSMSLIVDDCNKKALALYTKIGFKFEGYIKLEYGTFSCYTYYYNLDYTNNINYDLAKLASLKYQLFVNKLYKTKDRILGVYMKDLRIYAKKLDISYFNNIKYNTIETKLLGSILLNKLSKEELKKEMLKLLEVTDTWAITDSISQNVKQVAKNREYFLPFIEELITSNKEFYVRTGLIILLTQYKNETFYGKIYKLIDKVKINTYYVNMAIAWLLNSMSFIDDNVFTYIEKLNEDIKKMFYQKHRDSLRERNKL